jgi:membrane-bound lytic murein transglycosylase F
VKPFPVICRTLLFLPALAGTSAVLVHIFFPPSFFAHRKEYDLELRFAMMPPLTEPPREKESTLAAVPEQFRTLIAEKAAKHRLPPELIAGIIARESNFDPRCLSPDGGKGLMQLMPSVCREQNCADPFDPESNVESGTAHLAALRDQFSAVPDPAERIKFALAAYNGGAGHVLDARLLARKLKLDPDKWQGNVEEAIQFLKFRSFWKTARHGYCNADIVVNYVNSVLALAERFKNK